MRYSIIRWSVVTVVATVVIAALATPALGAGLVTSSTGATGSAGESITVTYTVANEGNSSPATTVDLNESTYPDDWVVTTHTGGDTYRSATHEAVFYGIAPGETVQVSYEIAVSKNSSAGSYQIDADTITADGRVSSTSANIELVTPLSISSEPVRVIQGTNASIPFTLSNQASTGQSVVVHADSIPTSWSVSQYVGGDVVRGSTNEIVYYNLSAGNTSGKFITMVPRTTSTGTYNVSITASTDGEVGQTATTKITVVDSVVDKYDSDNDNHIETRDFLRGVNDWQKQEVSTSQFLKLVNTWQQS